MLSILWIYNPVECEQNSYRIKKSIEFSIEILQIFQFLFVEMITPLYGNVGPFPIEFKLLNFIFHLLGGILLKQKCFISNSLLFDIYMKLYETAFSADAKMPPWY